MMRIIFRHISGTRATQVDVVTIGAHRELILGRATSAAVRFDAHRDNNVGRQHARISWSEDDPSNFSLVDLGSRNGTYLNGQRVIGPVVLSRGDIVRLGTTGPEIELDWDNQSKLNNAEQRAQL
jgi:pSer/pThr/pTyr-binding forkhead associated (FHA) protein